MFGNLLTTRKKPGVSPTPQDAIQAPAVSVPPVSPPSVLSSSMQPSVKQDLSVLSHLDAQTVAALSHAETETKRTRQQYIETNTLLYGLLFDDSVFRMLSDLGVDTGTISKTIQSQAKEGVFLGQPTLSDEAKHIFEQAYTGAKNRGSEFVSPSDVLLAMVTAGVSSVAPLISQGVTKEKLEEKLSKTTEFTTGKKSVLANYGIDLTQQAKDGKLDPIAGRDKEIDRLIHILLRRTKNNPIIIGEAGVGKTAIIEGVAENIVAGKVPKELSGKQIFQLDIAALVAGASHRGEFEERLKSVMQEAILSEGKTILFIDEIHTLMGTGEQEGALDASNIIKPYLARGQLQIIGTTTTSEYRKYFEKDKAFSRRFQPIVCEEPSEEVAVEMLKVLRPKYEKFHQVQIPDDTLESAVKLSKKYIGERYLPDKAVDLIDEAGADVRLSMSLGRSSDNVVKKSQVEQVVSNWTGIPITKLTEDESTKLLKLEERIHKRLIDQEEAVAAVSEAVRRGRIGLSNPNRPIASFVFLGPSGVGKTELAKTLAEILFGKDEAMIRLDMSEYMEKHEVAKLIGAPPGYVGYEEGGQLTEAVRAKPYSIVLFDEVEKAHPDVFNMLLQLLEDGRLTDNKGNTISFKNTIVICTSNIGSSLIQEKLSEQTKQLTPEEYEKQFSELSGLVEGELRKFFRPELLNRFDDVVIFKPLRREDMTAITKLGLAKTAKLLEEQGMHITPTEKAVAQLAKEGYDPVYGARPLRRLIQSAIENPIALQIIGKSFKNGDTIVIDYDEQKGEFTFIKQLTTAVGQSPSTLGQNINGVQPPSPVTQPQPPTVPSAEAAINSMPQEMPQTSQSTQTDTASA